MAKQKTGIDGLDKALNGGIPQGNLVLVSGGAGTGKSTLALQFLINGAKKFAEKGLYVSTEQSREELAKHAASFGWDLDALERTRKLKIEYFDVTEERNFLQRLDKAVLEFKPKRIAIDSLTTLTDAMMIADMSQETAFSLVQISESISPVPRTEEIVAKTMLYHLIKELRKHKVTTLMTTELYEDSTKLSADGVSEFISDGVVVMYFLGVGAVDLRSMRIRKMRYSSHDKDYLLYDIGKKGLEIKVEETFQVEE